MQSNDLFFVDKARLIPWLVLILGLFSVLVVAWIANRSITSRERARFEFASEDIVDQLKFKIESYAPVLRGLRVISYTSGGLNPEAIDTYVSALEVPMRYPGVQGIGYVRRVPHDQVEKFVYSLQAGFYPDYQIYSAPGSLPSDQQAVDAPAAPPADAVYPVIHLRPQREGESSEVGLNLATDPIRWEAMQRARDTGQYALTGTTPVKGIADHPTQYGFFMFVPIYGVGMSKLTTVEARREHLVAYVFAPFKAFDFLSTVVSRENSGFAVEVFDESGPTPSLLYATRNSAEAAECDDCFEVIREVELGGRAWQVRMRSLKSFANLDKMLIFSLSLVQLVLVCIIWLLSKSQGNAKRRAELATQEKEVLLASERAARMEVEKSVRIKEEFLATVSHELRSPLNAILGWAQLLSRSSCPPDRLLTGLETIDRNARLQAQLIDDLLDISRITSGKLKLDLRKIDIHAVISSATETVKSNLEAKQIELSVDFKDNNVVVLGDAARLQQVLWNVLSNAVKFSHKGGRISLTTVVSEGMLVITVRDEGIGISADLLPYIFERFRQGDSSVTRRHGGLGLGLSISRYICDLHNGSIIARSDGPDKGSEFIISLPIASNLDGKPNQCLADVSSSIGVVPELFGHKALVVDDEKDARDLLNLILRQLGMVVTLASSVDEALEALLSERFSIILSDLGMPDRDGFELAKAVRCHVDDGIRLTPMIALSAFVMNEDQERARQAGFSAQVPKPVDITVLVAKISRLVNGEIAAIPGEGPAN